MLKETPRDKAHTEHEPERQKELTSMLLDMDAKHGQWIILFYTSTHFGNLSLHPLSLLSPYWWKTNQSYERMITDRDFTVKLLLFFVKLATFLKPS